MMDNTQKKVMVVAAVAVLAFLLLRNWKKIVATTPEKGPDPTLAECLREYDQAVRPDVEKTPEEWEKYRMNWVEECVKTKITSK